MIHHALIKWCSRIFTCKEKGAYHTLLWSYLGIFRSWQRNKNYNTELHISKKCTNPIHHYHAAIRDQMDSCHKKAAMHNASPLRGRSAVRLHTMERKQKTEDKKAALLRYALL